jgi:DNA ligase D-like protein (predicted 3'-phosphoesterase)
MATGTTTLNNTSDEQRKGRNVACATPHGETEAVMRPTTDEYRRRRDFSHTPEPQGSDSPHPRQGAPQFVIQRHDAKLPHFDFRLEVAGVLFSWVIPDGLPREANQERLALQMENFPLEYLEFEGLIPADQYGGGKIVVWDRGTYRNLTRADGETVPIAEAIERGRVDLELHGAEAEGKYSLKRTENGREPRWSLSRS